MREAVRVRPWLRLLNTMSTTYDVVETLVGNHRRFLSFLEKRVESPTGYEAYLDRRNAQPYQRDTYGVRVFILRDTSSSKGYNVRTAFPIR